MRVRHLLFVSFVFFVVPLLHAQQTANELRAEMGLKKLADRFADDKADREKLRQDILTFRRSFSGTPQSVKAADMLRQMPSPLDHLDPSKIRPLEAFDWQPKELVAILGEHRGRQGAPASCVAYSPDRKFVASGGGHLVRLWETDPKRLLRLIVNLGASNVTCIAISPDSKQLAAGSIGYVHLFDLDGKNSKLRVSIPAGSTTITGVAFEPKGKPILACGSYDTKVRIFDLDKNDPKEMEICLLAKHSASVNGIAWSADGAHLASGSSDGTVRLWRYDGAKTDEAAKLDANPKGVNALAYSKDGRVMAAGCADGTILLWNMAAAKATARAAFPAHGPSAVTTLAFAPSGQSLFSGSGDALIRQWDITKKMPTKSAEYKGHAAGVTGVAVASDGGTLASSSSDWTMRLWDVTTRRERVPIDGHLSRPNALAFSPDAATLASGSEDHFIKLWSVTGDTPKERSAFKGEDYPLYSLTYAPDGKMLAGGQYTGVVSFWNVGGARPTAAGQIKDLPGYIYNLAFMPDGGRLLVHHYQTAGLYDVRLRTRVHLFEGDPKGMGLAGVALSPDGSRVAAGSGYYLKKGNDFVKNKDGSYVYVDSFLRLWDTDAGKLLHQEASAFPVYGAAFSPDGRQIASGAWEPILRFWDVAGNDLKDSDKPLKEAANVHTGGSHLYRFQYSADGRWLLTQATNYQIIIWDVAARKKIYEWGLPEYVGTATFAPDSRHLAISLATGVTYVLRLDGTARSAAK